VRISGISSIGVDIGIVSSMVLNRIEVVETLVGLQLFEKF
jgi:hypothetical protein